MNFKNCFFGLLVILIINISNLVFAQKEKTEKVKKEDFPCKVVKFIVPYVPGGSSDILARLIVPGLMERLNTTILVENKSGASGNIATMMVAQAKPDGCTWLLGNDTNVVVNRNFYKLPVDTIETLQPVAEMSSVPLILYVNSESSIENINELIEILKNNPNEHSYSTPGAGTTHHILTESLKLTANFSAIHVPYRGSAQAIAAVLSKDVSFAFDTFPIVLPYINSKKIKVLATTSSERLHNLSNVPTMKELGFDEFIANNWFGVFVTKGTPENLVKQLNLKIREVIKTTQVSDALDKQYWLRTDYNVDQYQEFVNKQAPYWTQLLKQTKVKVEID